MGRSRRCGKFFPAVPKMFDSSGNNVRSQSERCKSSSGVNGMTVGEISERLQVKHHTAVSLLDRLEARKLATRKRAAADKRNVNVQLTKAGASLLARLAAIHHRELQQRSPEIIDALRRLRE